MHLLQRIGYYLGGFAIGLILLAFFFNSKKTSCAYGPEKRVLKTITTKPIVLEKTIATRLQNQEIDTTLLKQIIQRGNVNFSKSEARKKPCGIYNIESNYKESTIVLTLKNCDSLAYLEEFRVLK